MDIRNITFDKAKDHLDDASSKFMNSSKSVKSSIFKSIKRLNRNIVILRRKNFKNIAKKEEYTKVIRMLIAWMKKYKRSL